MKSTADHIFYFMHPSKRVFCCTILLSTMLTALPGVVVHAETIAAPVSSPTIEQQKKTFEYLISNRKDPFVPFITEKATTSDAKMDEILDVNADLTGMQLFEPGQLNLVALMKSGQENLAMVEDFTGKGYVISEGTKIGKRGVVKEIAPNKVIIEETAETRAGQKIVTNIVMVLKKEGEE